MSRKVLVPVVYSWSIYALRYDEQEGSSSSGLLPTSCLNLLSCLGNGTPGKSLGYKKK